MFHIESHTVVFLTSPFLSCQGLGLIRSSVSAGIGGPSSSLTLDEDEESEGGTGELEGHSNGIIMQAGIRASTTASLQKHTMHSQPRFLRLPQTEDLKELHFNHVRLLDHQERSF